jgi:hypothetical protein
MDLAKKLVLMTIVAIGFFSIPAPAAQRMVIGEYITNWG